MLKATRQLSPVEPHREIEQLSLLEFGRLRPGVRWPSFDPGALQAGILHLGCGAFHRAHQNIYTQRAIELDGNSSLTWGVLGVSFRRKHIKQLLEPQDFLYTVLEHGPNGTAAQVVGVLKGVLFAREQAQAVVAAIKNPDTRIITLTVTPSGYLSLAPDNVGEPTATPDAIGLLIAGLAAVQVQGTSPPVLISCDNVPGNGRRLRQALVERARNYSPSLGSWIDRNVQFPSSVVDRIVPAATAADCALAGRLLGQSDLAAVSTEPFRQWVIEEFEGPRPPWHLAGAQFVSDTSPWEASKLSLLNGTHMAIAFLGILARLQTVSDFVNDPTFARYTSRLMLDEEVPAIQTTNHDLVSYSSQLLERWRNVHMKHQLQRVSRNGSDKLQPRLLTSLTANLAAGRAAPCTVLAVAAWVCCAGRLMPFDCPIEDRSSESLQRAADDCGGDTRCLLADLLSKHDIFGDLCSRHPEVEAQLGRAINFLRTHGVRHAVERINAMPVGSSW